jgi:surface antigen
MTALKRSLAGLTALVAICAVPPAASADPWKDESGHGRGRDKEWKHRDEGSGARCRGRGCQGRWHGAGPPSTSTPATRSSWSAATGTSPAASSVVPRAACWARASTTVTCARRPRWAAPPSALIGGTIGREIDLRDQACIGYALEYADSKEPVRWQDPDGVRYELGPGRRYRRGDGADCPGDKVFVDAGERRWSADEQACRRHDGAWVAG